jgi:hypothetical protein
VLLQHKGRFQQAAEGLLIEDWFVFCVRHDFSSAKTVG